MSFRRLPNPGKNSAVWNHWALEAKWPTGPPVTAMFQATAGRISRGSPQLTRTIIPNLITQEYIPASGFPQPFFSLLSTTTHFSEAQVDQKLNLTHASSTMVVWRERCKLYLPYCTHPVCDINYENTPHIIPTTDNRQHQTTP